MNREYAHEKQLGKVSRSSKVKWNLTRDQPRSRFKLYLEETGYKRDPRYPRQPPIKVFHDDAYRVEHIGMSLNMTPFKETTLRALSAEASAIRFESSGRPWLWIVSGLSSP